ncbi:MAG: hypothetical protein K6C06_06960 [Lachnospiraceae bacterium]|nr:hypothetical protein [Lachnospiraceae bacterium]
MSPAEYLFGNKKTVKPAPKKEAPRMEENKKNEKSSDQHDVDTVIKWLASYSRRNKCMLVLPGGLQIGDDKGKLTAILIRRTRVIGLLFFGYGGTVTAKSGMSDWNQKMNGQTRNIESPVKKLREQERILRLVLADAGYADLKTEVIGVFTSPRVTLNNIEGTGCYPFEGMIDRVRSDDPDVQDTIDPKQVGNALEKYLIFRRQQEENSEKQENPGQNKEN